MGTLQGVALGIKDSGHKVLGVFDWKVKGVEAVA